MPNNAQSMTRSTFLRGLGAFAVAPTSVSAMSEVQERPAPLDPEMVQQFVGAGHGNFDRVKELYEQAPSLLYSAHDWGGGDFETALEAAGHVGNKEIARFLLEKGARPNLHVLAMLGHDEIVLPALKAFPALLASKGPHGFSLLYHAKVGGEDSARILEYVTGQGLTVEKYEIR